MHNKKSRIIIFGGARGMGLWIANFFARSGHEIIIADIYKKTLDVAKNKGYKGIVLKANDLTPILDNNGYCDYDVAVVAVTINITPALIRRLAPKMKPGSLLMDITSVKEPAMKAMDDNVPPGVGVLGTHPMFGPDANSFFGRTCVTVPGQIHPPGRWLEWWERLLKQEGALNVTSTAEEHDQMMLLIQVLLHYLLICFGAVITKCGIDLDRANLFKSPMYEIMLAMISRLISQSHDTYYWIQKNPNGERIRNLFIQYSNDIGKMLKKITPSQFDKLLTNMKDSIGWTNVKISSVVAATIIRERFTQEKSLLQAEGEIACIENIETEKIHYGYIKEVAMDNVTIEELNKRGERVKISRKKVRLLDDREANNWKLQNLRTKSKQLSFITVEETNTDFLADFISKWLSVVRVRVIDDYSDSEKMMGKKKITLLIEVINDNEGEKAYSEIKKLLEGIGCSILL